MKSKYCIINMLKEWFTEWKDSRKDCVCFEHLPEEDIVFAIRIKQGLVKTCYN